VPASMPSRPHVCASHAEVSTELATLLAHCAEEETEGER
jgi:hypothetical protein